MICYYHHQQTYWKLASVCIKITEIPNCMLHTILYIALFSLALCVSNGVNEKKKTHKIRGVHMYKMGV